MEKFYLFALHVQVKETFPLEVIHTPTFRRLRNCFLWSIKKLKAFQLKLCLKGKCEVIKGNRFICCRNSLLRLIGTFYLFIQFTSSSIAKKKKHLDENDQKMEKIFMCHGDGECEQKRCHFCWQFLFPSERKWIKFRFQFRMNERNEKYKLPTMKFVSTTFLFPLTRTAAKCISAWTV